MNPVLAIQMMLAATELIQTLAPIISKAVSGGEASLEEQARVRDAVDKLRLRLASDDLGDHWRVDNDAL